MEAEATDRNCQIFPLNFQQTLVLRVLNVSYRNPLKN
jgi:hypothetical protein